jgi:hypothetical protein
MKTVKKIGIWSLVKFNAVIGAVFGLIVGVIYSLIMMIMGSMIARISAGAGMDSSGMNPGAFAAGFGIFGIILMPVLYAIFGAIGGAVMGLCWNLAAKLTGGIEVVIEDSLAPVAPVQTVSEQPQAPVGTAMPQSG